VKNISKHSLTIAHNHKDKDGDTTQSLHT